MKLGSGICSNCGHNRRYAKPSLKLCHVCNQRRLEAAKAERKAQLPAAEQERLKARKAGNMKTPNYQKNKLRRKSPPDRITARLKRALGNKPRPTKNRRLKYRRKTTGEARVFKEIWDEREHVCSNCGAPLPEPMRTYYFSHRLSKKRRPDLRLEKANIDLHCFECHYSRDFETAAKYMARQKKVMEEVSEKIRNVSRGTSEQETSGNSPPDIV